MRALTTLLVNLALLGICYGQQHKKYTEGVSLTYEEVIEAYKRLDRLNDNAALIELGPTDSGKNLHVFLIGGSSIDADLGLQEIARNKAIILINNGIHPGESCGVDASVIFAEEVLNRKIDDHVLLAIIPVYNIGGALNRNSFSRANQNGPKEYGFRGNARNLDLNRDFVKADALNTSTFFALFQALQPHIFIDTHTSNGADYQYTMSLISTQKDKLNPVVAKSLTNAVEPYLYRQMEKAGWGMTPYVNVFGYTPDKGFAGFLETPRYASGYTALFNTMGFITETHMLKPYKDRVESTLAFLHIMNAYVDKNYRNLISMREEAFKYDQQAKYVDINWSLDSSSVESREFKGYGYSYEASKVSGAPRLKYNRNQLKTYDIPYYNHFVAVDSVMVPEYYVVPKAWREVVFRLQMNGVDMQPLSKDTSIEVTSYYIHDAQFLNTPYEGHFFLKKMKVEKKVQERRFFEGDYLVSTKQKNVRFIVSVLEPNAVDSYLRWNFFDEIFQQKEHFSPYVFEETAERLLNEDKDLKQRYEAWKSENPDFEKNAYPSLLFIYQHSDYYEKEHLRYPVARIE